MLIGRVKDQFWFHAKFDNIYLLFKKIWNPTSVRCGISSLFLTYKKGIPLFSNSHISPPLKAIWTITQLFWVFTFYLNFLGN